MSVKLLTIYLVFSIHAVIQAQNPEPLIIIDNQNTYPEEFISRFKKCYSQELLSNRDTVEYFLNQFIFMKQVVREAKKQGLDRSKIFRDEMNMVLNHICKFETVDKETIEFYSKQSYTRAQTEIHIRHILISIDANASPEDTLLAFQKALNIRTKLAKGADFKVLAKSVSDDPSAILNGGDLWFVKPFEIPAIVEDYIYSKPSEKFSFPLRSNSGYHIIEILEERPAKGRFKVAHILFALPLDSDNTETDKLKIKVDSIYKLILQGADFNQLAQKYSEDKGTAANGGELPWFGTGIMPHEFELASFSLKNDGNVSKPVKTEYGWHIIKRLAYQENPSYEQIRPQLVDLVINSERGKVAENIKTSELKNKLQFKEYYSELGLIEIVDSTVFKANWKIPDGTNLSAPLFSFSGKTYTQQDFILYIENNQHKSLPIPLNDYIRLKYNDFVNNTIKNYIFNSLQKVNPSIYATVSALEENMLFSKMMDKEVWNKAITDTEGLKEYYRIHKTEYNKKLVADVCLYSYKSNKAIKVEKSFKKYKIGNTDDSLLVLKMRKSIDPGFSFIGCKKHEEGTDPIIDKCINLNRTGHVNQNQSIINLENDKILVYLNDEIKPTNKSFEMVKPILIKDYQKYLETGFHAKLNKNYNTIINQSILDSIINQK